MKMHVRIIFGIMLLLVGLQWIGDPVEARLTGDWSAPAGWHELDNNGPDNSHHHGLTTLRDMVLALTALLIAGPAFLEYLLPAPDARKPQTVAISHRIPRAPPDF